MRFHSEKSSWGPGPWQDEPDHEVWIDEATNLDCMINRGPMGGLCGYVGVPPEHPFHGLDYQEVPVDVHGGLTYGELCQEEGDICHVPEPGRSAHVFWFGFDCGHSMDVLPHMAAQYPDYVFHEASYKTIDYVRREVTTLAFQLAMVVS